MTEFFKPIETIIHGKDVFIVYEFTGSPSTMKRLKQNDRFGHIKEIGLGLIISKGEIQKTTAWKEMENDDPAPDYDRDMRDADAYANSL